MRVPKNLRSPRGRSRRHAGTEGATGATFSRLRTYLLAWNSIAAFGKGPDEREDDMIKAFPARRGHILVWSLAAVLLILPALSAQTAAGLDPAKTYAKFLGKYEFDFGGMGGGQRIFEFYVKDGAFWIEYGFTSPGELKAVANSADKFTFIDPDDGLIKIAFEKDAAGQYTKCRMVAESLSLDIVGTKQK
jgi:hypothetical protein